MSDTTTSAGSQPPAAVVLGDGTVSVTGARHPLRLSETRTRWWNGRIWERTADTTPWNAIFDGSRERWWDGADWQPVRKVLPWLLRPLQLVVLQLVVPFLWLPVLVGLGAGPGVSFMLITITNFAIYFALVVPSKVLTTRVRSALFFGAIGMLALGAWDLWQRATRGAADVRPAKPMAPRAQA